MLMDASRRQLLPSKIFRATKNAQLIQDNLRVFANGLRAGHYPLILKPFASASVRSSTSPLAESAPGKSIAQRKTKSRAKSAASMARHGEEGPRGESPVPQPPEGEGA